VLTVRRWLPPVIAIVVVAAVVTFVWLANRSTPVPSKPPASAPAVGSCWNVADATVGSTLPWPSTPVDCASTHTAQVFYVGQVDHDLVRNGRTAKGQDAQINTLLMSTEARAGCLAEAGPFVGGSWRAAQLSVYPAFIAPASDGFYACSVAQVADPAGDRLVPRSASLAGALAGAEKAKLGIDCVGGTGSPNSQLTFVTCDQLHVFEFVGLYTVTPLGAPFDKAQVADAVNRGCTSLVYDYVGLPAGKTRSDLRISPVGPDTANTWAGSDQTFACYASGKVPMKGSVKNLGTRPLPH
jgi:hypothetical protein